MFIIIDMYILNDLQQLGLSDKEAATYLAILKLENASPHQIAAEAAIERTTVYKILEELAIKGLVAKSIKGTRLVYSAESPENLKQMVERQNHLVEKIFPTLLAFQGKNKKRPNIRYYDNIEGIKKVLIDSLNSTEKVRRDFASVESIVDFLGQTFIDHQIEQRVAKGIEVRSLRSIASKESVDEKDWSLRASNKDVLREARYLNEKFIFEQVIIIYDQTVSIFSSKKESFALQIDSRELSQAMKVLFDIAWHSAGK